MYGSFIVTMNNYVLIIPTRGPSIHCKNLSNNFLVINVELCQFWGIESKIVIEPVPSESKPQPLQNMHLFEYQLWEADGERCTCHSTSEGRNATI